MMKIIGFLLYKKDRNKRTYLTFQQYIQAFSSYHKNHNLDNIVLSIGFKIYKSGLRREMEGGYYHNAKNWLTLFILN